MYICVCMYVCVCVGVRLFQSRFIDSLHTAFYMEFHVNEAMRPHKHPYKAFYMEFHVNEAMHPLKHPFTWKFHVNGAPSRLKHPPFHVNGSIYKEKDVLDLPQLMRTPSNSPKFVPSE